MDLVSVNVLHIVAADLHERVFEDLTRRDTLFRLLVE